MREERRLERKGKVERADQTKINGSAEKADLNGGNGKVVQKDQEENKYLNQLNEKKL